MAKDQERDDISAQDLAMIDEEESSGALDELSPEEQAYLDADAAGLEPPAAEEDEQGEKGKTDAETASKAETEAETEAGVLDPDKEEDAAEAADKGEEGDSEEDEGQGDHQKMVNHGAFHKERERRKEAESRISKLEEQITKGNERLQVLTELFSGKKDGEEGADDPAPDPEEDIFGYAKWQGRQIEKLQSQLADTAKGVESANQKFQERDSQSDLVRSYAQDAQAYMTEKPDFMDAYNHLVSSRDRELTRLGYSDARERARIIADEEMGMVKAAFQRGERPAEIFYEAARERGYAPKAANGAAESGAEADGGDKKDTETAAAENGKDTGKEPAKSTGADKIAAVEKGKQASKSLSNMGGGEANVLDIETLANMSDEEFNALAEKDPGQIDRILGA